MCEWVSSCLSGKGPKLLTWSGLDIMTEVPHNVPTIVTFSCVVFERNWNQVVPSTHVSIPKDGGGLYSITGNYSFVTPSQVGYAQVRFLKNQLPSNPVTTPFFGQQITLITAAKIELKEGDVIQVQVLQTSGETLQAGQLLSSLVLERYAI